MPKQSRFIALATKAKTQIQELTVDQIRERVLLGDQFLLLDVREPAEWLQGHVAGAVHLSRGLLEQTIESIADPSTPIVLYCGAGLRSALAAASLKEMGYSQVFVMAGGYAAWNKGSRNPGLNKLLKSASSRVRFATLDEVQEMADVVKIDVREVAEWKKGTIPHSLNLPRGVVESLIEGKVPDIATRVVLFCTAGNRSTLAADSLGRMGYGNVFVMQGGLQAWRARGLPIHKPE